MNESVTEMSEQTVFLVEDDEAVRNSISRILENEGLSVRSFSTPSGIIEAFENSERGCLVLDLRLGEMSGLELQRTLHVSGCRLPFIIITGQGEIPDAMAAIRSGAVDFLEKPVQPYILIERVKQALEEDRRRYEQDKKNEQIKNQLDSLSRRERQVLDYVVSGMLTKNIARKLGIAVKTVEAHRSNITKKMNVKSVVQLVRNLTCYEQHAQTESMFCQSDSQTCPSTQTNPEADDQ